MPIESPRILRGLTLLLALTSALASPLMAVEPTPAPAAGTSPTVAPTPASPSLPATGGLIVARDPETGALSLPTPTQRRELFPAEFGAALQSIQPLFEETMPGGGTMIRLDGLLMDYAVASRGADGKLLFTCVHEAGDAVRLTVDGITMPTVSPEPEEE